MFSIFRAADDVDVITDQTEVKKKYRYWRLRIFFSMYFGYALFYITRKSLTYTLPGMMEEFSWSVEDVGLFGSVLYITYGLSKFFSGIAADRSNPRYFMAAGLFMTGILNLLFGASSSIVFFLVYWALNGIFQGWGWPPCARLLTHWYARSERGGWWGVWNSSHNIGGGIALFMTPLIVGAFGWRMAMYIPGIICTIGGVILAISLRDTPGTLGLPPIEKHKKEDEDDLGQEKQISTKDLLFKYVLGNKIIWVLAISYFFIYVIRTAVNDLGQLYLMQKKGHSLMSAAGALFWFEIGGLCGSVVAGFLSDYIFSGKRGPVNVIYTFSVIFGLAALWFIPSNNLPLASIAVFIVGFFIFGPQMLIGMVAAEVSHKKAAGTATGFTGWFGYFGAAAGAYPFGVIATRMGWGSFLIALGACSVVAVMVLVPLWSLGSRADMVDTKEPKATT